MSCKAAHIDALSSLRTLSFQVGQLKFYFRFPFVHFAARSELPVPAPMSIKGDSKGNWKFFRSQYSNYEIATVLYRKDDNIRVATLLTIMDKDCYQIYEILPLSADDREKVKNILDGLEAHFKPATNVSNNYLCRLRKMSKTCAFETFHNQMIRDRIVIGTKDTR